MMNIPRQAEVWLPTLCHKVADALRNLSRCGIERQMARIEYVDFGLRHVTAIGLRFRKLE
jgi:hypothetical protein